MAAVSSVCCVKTVLLLKPGCEAANFQVEKGKGTLLMLLLMASLH